MELLGARPDIKKLDALKASAKHARLPHEKEWWLNLAFYLGEQYTMWSPQLNTVQRIPRRKDEKHRPRPVVNKIRHFVNQQHAFALQNKPVPDVIPTTDDLISMSLAQVSLAYASWAAQPGVTGFPRTLSRAVHGAVVQGEAYLKWLWDAEAKQPRIEFVMAHELYLDPYATEWVNVRYIIHEKFMDREQVYDKYGKELKAKPDRQDASRASLLRELGQAPVLEGYAVQEIWHKPSRRHPKGLYAVWTGTEFLVPPRDLPYRHLHEHRRLPFTQIGVVPRDGSVHYDSMVKDLRSPQMELNKYHAQRIEIRENFANPKWWVPDELELEANPNDTPNQVLRGSGDQGLKPEIIQATSMGDNSEGDWIKTEMMDAVGLHEVSQAQVPGRVESSKAIELLKEADASRLSELTETTSEAIAEGFWQILQLARQYEAPKRLVTIYSAEGVPEVKEFKARHVDPGMRFTVTMGTGLAYSRAGRTDQLLNLWDRGVLQDDPQRLLMLLDVAAGQLPLSSKAADIREARNENLSMSKGKAIKPDSWDDHEVHLREHNTYRKSPEYELLSPRARAVFEFHCDTHEKLLDAALVKMAQRAQLAAMAQGQGGPPPPTGGEEGGPEQPEPGEEPSTPSPT